MLTAKFAVEKHLSQSARQLYAAGKYSRLPHPDVNESISLNSSVAKSVTLLIDFIALLHSLMV